MEVILGISNRHVHLQEEDYILLFGDTKVEKVKDLVQTGEFASNLVVDLETPKSKISKVRVLGPWRNYTQVEISKTDCYTLGIDAPIRTSGDLEGAAEVKIIGPCGSITKNCAIIANRHLHINHDDRVKLNLLDVEKISIKVESLKGAILNDVYIKETPKGVLEVHLDTDDGNACFLKTGDKVELII